MINTAVITVLLHDEDGTLTEYTVRAQTRDLTGWELISHRKGWPLDAANLSQTWIAWSALKREGHFAGDFEDFQDACVGTSSVLEEVRPTTAASAD
ncbi:hypothetical protein [Actinomyces urogenitalis]|uniref:hypothetical protein n=1 Tax=Actinomyces urogenitalis TaxID=103621 RepID=UPI0024304BF4|nr:hypothetical protein [Actinomyces urogenitalis]MCI7456990.1 hypothetical protein [Actinomyces urogenitalis]